MPILLVRRRVFFLFWLFRLWNRYILVRLSFAMTLCIFICGMMLIMLKVRPSIFSLFVYCRMLLLISKVFILDIGTIWNLFLFVFIFHLFS